MAQESGVGSWLRPDVEYTVLAIEHLPERVTAYRIVTRQGTPALFQASLFDITDPRVDRTWVAQCTDLGDTDLVPGPWNFPGFWESFFNGQPEAVALYQEVLRHVTGSKESSEVS